MRRLPIRWLIGAFLLQLFHTGLLAQDNNFPLEAIKPTISGPTCFAIIVDSVTFFHVREAIELYRRSIEEDGLPAYILVAQWSHPEQVRYVIRQLYRQENSRLEGVVLVGEIPIVFLGGAQHLTSAFKMDEDKFPPFESFVPTDRYYDDLNLDGEYVGQDSIDTLIHYYTLRSTSPAVVQRELYSARIRTNPGDGDKYDRLKRFFEKVALRKSRPFEPLDQVVTAYGYGYISDSYTAIMDEVAALRQNLNLGTSAKGTVLSLFHLVHPNLKEQLLRTITRNNWDLFMLHCHGQVTKQFIEVGKNLALTAFPAEFDSSITTKSDTTIGDDGELSKLDLVSRRLGPELIILDVCYNGAFQLPECLAVNYLFTEGEVVAVVGNSVNVRQDVTFIDDLGALRCGVRIGIWHQLQPYLESHLFGDPTFRFARTLEGKHKFSPPFQLASPERPSAKHLREIFHKSSDAYLRASALAALYELGHEDTLDLAIEALDDPSCLVRLKAWFLLAKSRSQTLFDLLPTALDDPYELIRRYAVIWMGEIGSGAFIPYLAKAAIEDPSERVVFNALSSLKFIDGYESEVALEQIAQAQQSLWNGKFFQLASTNLDIVREWLPQTVLPGLTADEPQTRIQIIKLLRANHHLTAVPFLIQVLETDTVPQVRKAAAEALGWFTFYEHREQIIIALDKIIENLDAEEITEAALLSKKRLVEGPNRSNTP